jgi:tripartite-type tricarboxylate transporter receptor subunit TctC
VRIIVPFAPGGPSDITARLMGMKLGEVLGQTFVVENRAGAGSNLGTLAVARSAPDGYTLLVTSSAFTVNPSLYKQVPYDPFKDFTPIARIGSFASVITVTPEKPYQTMQALVAYAKANPGKLSYGVGNSTSHIVGETLKRRTGTDIVRVPYRSNPAVMTDLLANQIQIMIADFNTGMPQLKAGKVNPLAVLTRTRNPALPDVPTLNETVMPGYHILAWAGMFGPAAMPPEAVKVLAGAIEAALNKPEVRQRFTSSGTDIYWSGPQEFDAFVKTELVSWTAMIREAGIEPE